jgi:hypothetical protein
LLAGAGAAVAGTGLAVGGVSPAIADDDSSAHVGLAPPGATACEFRCRISQTGASGGEFAGVGYLTVARGLPSTAVFAGEPRNESTALFTLVATGHLVQRVLDQNVHALDIAGSLTVHERATPGASFDDPASFRTGRPVAVFELMLQDILAVFAPGHGIPTLSGDLTQVRAHRLASGRRFGRIGAGFRMLATGLGTLVDPVTLNAELEMAGNWVATGARNRPGS